MDTFVIGRNKAKDLVVFAPMLFLLIGGIYLLVEGRSGTFYLALAGALIPLVACSYFTVQWLGKTPIIRFSAEGIFTKSLGRTIAWEKIAYVKVTTDGDITDSDGSRNRTQTKHLVIFEITEIKDGQNYGFERKQNIRDANIDEEALANVARQFFDANKLA